MTQPPYRSTEGHPMRRFAIFATVLAILVVVGSQPWGAAASKKSFCVCVTSRAGLILRSMKNRSAVAKTQAPSKARFTDVATVTQ
jgi:hypothetical protein